MTAHVRQHVELELVILCFDAQTALSSSNLGVMVGTFSLPHFLYFACLLGVG